MSNYTTWLYTSLSYYRRKYLYTVLPVTCSVGVLRTEVVPETSASSLTDLRGWFPEMILMSLVAAKASDHELLSTYRASWPRASSLWSARFWRNSCGRPEPFAGGCVARRQSWAGRCPLCSADWNVVVAGRWARTAPRWVSWAPRRKEATTPRRSAGWRRVWRRRPCVRRPALVRPEVARTRRRTGGPGELLGPLPAARSRGSDAPPATAGSERNAVGSWYSTKRL